LNGFQEEKVSSGLAANPQSSIIRYFVDGIVENVPIAAPDETDNITIKHGVYTQDRI
jgi:hypothetical protein